MMSSISLRCLVRLPPPQVPVSDRSWRVAGNSLSQSSTTSNACACVSEHTPHKNWEGGTHASF
eukprot:1333414-Rhodomonas_salina.1